jgi:hypothetical protein
MPEKADIIFDSALEPSAFYEKWKAIHPNSADGQAFSDNLRAMFAPIWGDDLHNISFVLADSPEPWVECVHHGDQKTVVVSKGLIAHMPYESNLAAVVAYGMLRNGFVPPMQEEKQSGIEFPDKKFSSMEISMQTVECLRAGGYSEGALLAAFEVLEDANRQHPLGDLGDLLGQHLSAEWRSFSTKIGLASRTRTEGMREGILYDSRTNGFELDEGQKLADVVLPIDSSKGRGLVDEDTMMEQLDPIVSKGYAYFQVDVASCKHESFVDRFLAEHHVDGASPEDQAHVLIQLLDAMPGLGPDQSFVTWQGLYQRAYQLAGALEHDELLQAELVGAFRENIALCGSESWVPFLTGDGARRAVSEIVKNADVMVVQDAFGFVSPFEVMLNKAFDNAVPILLDVAQDTEELASSHVYQWEWEGTTEERTKAINHFRSKRGLGVSLGSVDDFTFDPDNMEANNFSFAELLSSISFEDDRALTPEELIEGYLDAAGGLKLSKHIKTQYDILLKLQELQEENPEHAGRLAHHLFTYTNILDPVVFDKLKGIWVEGLSHAFEHVDADYFEGDVLALIDDILLHNNPWTARVLLNDMANALTLQADLTFQMKDKLDEKMAGALSAPAHAVGPGEMLASHLMKNPKQRGDAIALLLDPEPERWIEQLDALFEDYDLSNVDFDALPKDIHDTLHQYRTRVEPLLEILKATGRLDEEQIARFGVMMAGVESVIQSLENAKDDPEKLKFIKEKGIDAYLHHYSGGTLDRESIDQALQLAHKTFWHYSTEVRGVVMAALLFGDGKHPDALMPGHEETSIRDFVMHALLPDSLPDAIRKQVEVAFDTYLENTTSSDQLAILGFALALHRPQDNVLQGENVEEAQGKAMMQLLNALGPAGRKLGQAIQGNATVSESIRQGMSNIKDNTVDLSRWELIELVKSKVPAEVFEKIDHIGEMLGSGSNQFTVEIIYEGKPCALTCLHDFVREKASYEFGILDQIMEALIEDAQAQGHDSAMLEVGRGVLKRARAGMHIEHNYDIGEWQVKQAAEMYNDLEITVNGMPIRFDVVEWITHGQEFKIETIAQGTPFMKLEAANAQEEQAIQNLAVGLITAEKAWVGGGKIFDSDRHDAQQKIVPIRDDNGDIVAWQVNIFDLGGLLTEKPTARMKAELGRALGEALLYSQERGTTFRQEVQQSILDHAFQAERSALEAKEQAEEARASGQDRRAQSYEQKQQQHESVAAYLYEVPKSEMAQQGYYQPLKEAGVDYGVNGAILGSLFRTGRVDPHIARGFSQKTGRMFMHDFLGSANQKAQSMASDVMHAASHPKATLNRILGRHHPEPQEAPPQEASQPHWDIKVSGGRNVTMNSLPG